MKESMLTDPALLQTATKLIKLCEVFANFILVKRFFFLTGLLKYTVIFTLENAPSCKRSRNGAE